MRWKNARWISSADWPGTGKNNNQASKVDELFHKLTGCSTDLPSLLLAEQSVICIVHTLSITGVMLTYSMPLP